LTRLVSRHTAAPPTATSAIGTPAKNATSITHTAMMVFLMIAA
jgi:hypothetical protein